MRRRTKDLHEMDKSESRKANRTLPKLSGMPEIRRRKVQRNIPMLLEDHEGGSMDKERLKRFIKWKINKETDLEIIQKQKESISKTTASYNGEHTSGGRVIQDSEAEKLVRILDQYKNAEKIIANEIAAEEIEIKRNIDRIEKDIYQAILKKKYIQGKPLEEIADEIGYTYKHTCRLHGYALNEWEKL